MNIKILDSHLKEYLQTKATAKEIAKNLSLSSVSIERVESFGNDFVYDIEVTTNRPDLASVIGIAREAGAVLPQFGIPAKYLPPHVYAKKEPGAKVPLIIKSDPKLVNRVCAVVMDITIKKSPKEIQDRLEQSDIRSLNNIVDVTNFVMRTIGHPTHVFDYDRIAGNTITIRESKQGEEIVTLDNKSYTLTGGDIVAIDKNNNIIDLLGVMGLQNSVVTNTTKRIVFFVNNNETSRIRKTSMGLGIRTEAAQLNEKGVDPELAMTALLFGIKMYQQLADGVVVSDIIDIYPNPIKPKTVSVEINKINSVVGVDIPVKTSMQILTNLGFTPSLNNNMITTTVPSSRAGDVTIPEDLIEEIARVYGYHNLPSSLPPMRESEINQISASPYFWEKKVKDALKYWGFTETYTYSFVSEDLLEGPTEDAVTLANPLSKDWVYMRKTLIPSLLQVLSENKGREEIRIFELANVYEKNGKNLPTETRMLAGVLKKKNASFYEIKGILEQLFVDLGIVKVTFTKRKEGGSGADVFINKKYIGNVEVLDTHLINFELNFEELLAHATTRKIYKPIAKYPPIVEDISVITLADTATIIDEIQSQSQNNTQVTVSLLDEYQTTRTFHIVYQNPNNSLTNDEVKKIREEIIQSLIQNLNATIK